MSWRLKCVLVALVVLVACGGAGTTSTTSSGGGGGAGGAVATGGTTSSSSGTASGSSSTSSGTASSSSSASSASSGTVGPPVVNHPPSILSTAVTSAVTGAPYYYALLAQDLDGDTLTYSLTQAPAGMTIDASTGLVAWSPGPGDAGATTVSVRVEDPQGAFDAQPFTLTTTAGTQPPKITSTPPLVATPGGTYTYHAAAVDPDDTTLTWLVTGPAGMTVGQTTGIVSWPVPSISGGVPVTLTVTDGTGGKDTQAFSIGVATGSSSAPSVSIASPGPDAMLAGVTSVTGTASAPNLAGYALSMCRRGWGHELCSPVASGLSSVTNGLLGELDARLVANGAYTLVLTAKTADNVTATAAVDVQVRSEDKLGALRLLFTDLVVETPTGEVQLERLYDGLDLSPGELGHGWRCRFSVAGHGEQPELPQLGWTLSYTSFPPPSTWSRTTRTP